MNVVIIAGGSGTRLWPLSTPDYPKHLLKLTNEKSLLQNTVDRVRGFASKIFVVSETSHITHIYEQLDGLVPKENIIVEPARRGTANCLILALRELRLRKVNEEPILFLWGDNLTRDQSGFGDTMAQARKLAVTEKRPVFIGVEPTYAATGFGYMEKGSNLDALNGVYELQRFVEKPDKATAEKYFKSGGYLWNTGYAVGLLETFEREVKQHNKLLWKRYKQLITESDMQSFYTSLPSEAMEYALTEKIQDGIVVAGTFVWFDVGSFKDLHAISSQNDSGNFLQGKLVMTDNVTNSYIRSEIETPLAVIGLDNVVVVQTDHGIVVANINHSQRVGDIAKKLHEVNEP